MGYFEERVSTRVSKKISSKTLAIAISISIVVVLIVSLLLYNNFGSEINTAKVAIPKTYSNVQNIVEKELIKYDNNISSANTSDIKDAVITSLAASEPPIDITAQTELIEQIIETSILRHKEQKNEELDKIKFSSDVAAQIAELTRKVDENNKKYLDLVNSYNAYKNDVSQKINEINTITQKLEVIRSTEENPNEAITAIEEEIRRNENSNTSTEKKVEKLKEYLTLLEKTSSVSTTELKTDLKNKITEVINLSNEYNETTAQKLNEVDKKFLTNESLFSDFVTAYGEYQAQTETTLGTKADAETVDRMVAELDEAIKANKQSLESIISGNSSVLNKALLDLGVDLNANKAEAEQKINDAKTELLQLLDDVKASAETKMLTASGTEADHYQEMLNNIAEAKAKASANTEDVKAQLTALLNDTKAILESGLTSATDAEKTHYEEMLSTTANLKTETDAALDTLKTELENKMDENKSALEDSINSSIVGWVNSLNAYSTTVSQSLDSHQTELNNITSRLDNFAEQTDQKFGVTNQKISDLETSVNETINESISNINNNIENLQNNINNSISTEITNIKDDLGGKKIWSGTQQEYDALPTKDDNTLYFVS